ncbi:MAG TPA: glycoside hydrolase family 3 protein [candidate division Zixibacteria bacterium]|nr:glycoside hydrolase family 3 protein [candidate division Zixibacteria bacterium]
MSPTHRLTRRAFLAVAGASTASAVLAACGSALRSVAGPTPATPSPAPTFSPTPTPTSTPAGPPLRVKAAQMLLVGFRGMRPEETGYLLPAIREHGLGGVVLFDVDLPTGGPRNIGSPEQLASLTSALQEESVASPSGLPLVITVDQEGGRVARLTPTYGFPPVTPTAAELGAGDPEATRDAGAAIGQVLAGAGVTMNLAPVVDLNVNPASPAIGALHRSFSADAEQVIRHAEAFVAGHHGEGVQCAIKHYPGHGSATGDTHRGVVDVTATWSEVELEPFAALCRDGRTDAVLTAHIVHRGIDPEHPATLSRAWIADRLRTSIGWDGVVISDDLQMGAIRDAYGHEEAVRLAIEAGVDLLLIANQQAFEEDVVTRTVDRIVELVESGRVDEERIDRSWQRITALKAT